MSADTFYTTLIFVDFLVCVSEKSCPFANRIKVGQDFWDICILIVYKIFQNYSSVNLTAKRLCQNGFKCHKCHDLFFTYIIFCLYLSNTPVILVVLV